MFSSEKGKPNNNDRMDCIIMLYSQKKRRFEIAHGDTMSFFGYSEKETTELFLENEEENCMSVFKCVSKKMPIDKTITYTMKDGKSKKVHFMADELKIDGLKTIFCQFYDVTGGRRAFDEMSKNAPIGIFLFSVADFIMYGMNGFFYSMTGISETVNQYDLLHFVSDEYKERLIQISEETQKTGSSFFLECDVLTPNGPLTVQLAGRGCESECGDRIIACVMLDATELSLYRSYHDISRNNLASISGTVPGGSFVYNMRGGQMTYTDRPANNKAFSNICTQHSVNEQIRDEWKRKVRENSDKSRFEFECSFVRDDGTRSAIHFDSYLTHTFGDTRVFTCFYSEPDELFRNRMEKEEQDTRFQLLLEYSSDIVFSYNIPSDTFTYVDKVTYSSFEDKTRTIQNFSTELLSGKLGFESATVDPMEFLRGETFVGDEVRLSSVINGRTTTRWFVLRNRVLSDSEGRRRQTSIGTLHDITDEKMTQFELERTTKLDALTEFYNNDAFHENAESIYKFMTSNQKPCAVVAFKIRNLEQLNENVGMLYGDTVLKNLAEKIRTGLVRNSIVGRISGNMFIALLHGITAREAVIYDCERIAESFSGIYSDVSSASRAVLDVGIAFSGTQDFLQIILMTQIALAKCTDEEHCVVYSGDMDVINEPVEETNMPIRSGTRSTVSMDALTTELCKMLITTVDTDAAINSILALVGQRYGVSRVYIFQEIGDTHRISNTFEWTSEGIKKCRDRLQNVEIGDYEQYTRMFENDIFYVSDKATVTRVFPALEKAYRTPVDDITILQFAIRDRGRLFGFIGFDVYYRRRVWNTGERDQLALLTGFLGSQLSKLRAQADKSSEHMLFGSIINHMKLSVYSVDPETHKILYSNYYSDEEKRELNGQKCYEVIMGKDKPCDNCPILGLSSGSDYYSTRTYNDLTGKWSDVSAFSMTDFYGRKSTVISVHNLTDYNCAIAETDQLTASPTFNVFTARVEQIMRDYPGDEYVMFFINCKKLRIVNETYGFATGNKILISIAAILMENVDKDETFTRVSADKFAVFKRRSSIEEKFTSYDNIILRFRNAVARMMSESVNHAYINFNIGIYEAENGKSPVAEMLDKSCIAAKLADSLGTNNSLIYDKKLSAREENIARIESEADSAMQNGEFRMYLQPKFDLRTGSLSGAEALSRWVLPDGQIRSPAEYIPIFEQNGFISQLDFYMYEEAAKLIRKWLDDGLTPVLISVNVSRAHINNTGFASRITSLLKKYNIPNSMLELELTETMFADSSEQMVDFIENLHDLGFKISIDDFGSGYSSLNLLKDMSIDVLKLDKSLFSKKQNSKEKPLLEGVVSIARNLNMETICEGVETEEQVEFLRRINCDCAQGFLYQRPIPIEKFEALYMKKPIKTH